MESTEKGRKKIKPKLKAGDRHTNERHDLGRRRTKKKRGENKPLTKIRGKRRGRRGGNEDEEEEGACGCDCEYECECEFEFGFVFLLLALYQKPQDEQHDRRLCI